MVLHEGDQRRNDDREAFADDGGQLIAEGLPASGGQQGEDIVSLERFGDNLLLQRSKGVMAEVALESISSGIQGWSGRHERKSE